MKLGVDVVFDVESLVDGVVEIDDLVGEFDDGVREFGFGVDVWHVPVDVVGEGEGFCRGRKLVKKDTLKKKQNLERRP